MVADYRLGGDRLIIKSIAFLPKPASSSREVDRPQTRPSTVTARPAWEASFEPSFGNSHPVVGPWIVDDRGMQ